MTALSRSDEAFRPLAPALKLMLVAEILVTYARVRWCMRGSDLPTTVASLRVAPGNGSPHEARSALVNGWRLGSAVIRTLRLLPTDSRCLVRSLVLTRLLARRGIQASLVIGVHPGQEFAAHAWVEHQGSALLPAEETKYARLVEM
jgi:hypothetical protein